MKVIINIPELSPDDFDHLIATNYTLSKKIKTTNSVKVRTRCTDPQIIAASIAGGAAIIATLIRVISDYITKRKKDESDSKQLMININTVLNIPCNCNEDQIAEKVKKLLQEPVDEIRLTSSSVNFSSNCHNLNQ